MTHQHFWYASFAHFHFLGSVCSECKERRFLGGYRDERCNRIVERLNRSWRVR